MKVKSVFLLTAVMFLATGCALFKRPSSSSSLSSSATSSSEKTSSSSASSGKTSSQTVSSTSASESNKVKVAAHTIKDSNPPININSQGQVVTKDVWNSFKNGNYSFFNGHYNYTYRSYAGGYETIEAFTKNGYYMRSNAGKLYYERKSGDTFYQYIEQKDGWLRDETTLDIQSKYTYRLVNEIYVHMFDFDDYEYDSDVYDGSYIYRTTAFGSTIKFQGGYLTYLYYGLGMSFFEIKLAFETEIEIPESYYYK